MGSRVLPVQQRSRDRRESLLRAAAELIAEGGPRAVTHRAVANRARVPQASTTYYFDSIHQLTDEALRLHLSERTAELQAMIASASGKGNSPEQVARMLSQMLIARTREIAIAQFEVYLQAGRDPELRGYVEDALATFASIAESVLKFLGARDPVRAAPAFVALIDGFLLHRVARPREVEQDAEALFEALRALFIAHVMDEREFGRWRERLNQAFPPPE
ncbi:MAG TPA: TetR family transcriptional regulator [Streptosporangiaceae bacterium]|nr:TetR family transcriptional regulator [Streptosporangiaceae bacterium]